MPRRVPWATSTACLAGTVLLCGCAAPLRVTQLATGQPTVAAYELFGDNLAQLQSEAARLCGGQAEVLRESSSRREWPASDDVGRLARMWRVAQQTMDPPRGDAQLMVRCAPNPDRSRLVAKLPQYEPVPLAGDAPAKPWWSFLAFWRKPAAAAKTNSGSDPAAAIPYGY